MIAYAGGKRIEPEAGMLRDARGLVVLVERAELTEAAEKLGLAQVLRMPESARAANRFERHPEHERLLLHIPEDGAEPDAPYRYLGAYYTANWMVLVYDPSQAVERLREQLEGPEPPPLSGVLYTLLAELTARDEERLEDTEEDIAALEDAIAEGQRIDYNARISALRRRLLRLKRYYESLQDALEDLEENPSGYWGGDQLARFHLLTGRAERLFRSVLNLRDYVTQVREAYQAQMDISMNRTMQLFTVITAVFLPLTLLVGWYGMNLRMPEYDAPWAYPVVIVAALVIAVGCVVYFRRRRWF